MALGSGLGWSSEGLLRSRVHLSVGDPGKPGCDVPVCRSSAPLTLLCSMLPMTLGTNGVTLLINQRGKPRPGRSQDLARVRQQ